MSVNHSSDPSDSGARRLQRDRATRSPRDRAVWPSGRRTFAGALLALSLGALLLAVACGTPEKKVSASQENGAVAASLISDAQAVEAAPASAEAEAPVSAEMAQPMEQVAIPTEVVATVDPELLEVRPILVDRSGERRAEDDSVSQIVSVADKMESVRAALAAKRARNVASLTSTVAVKATPKPVVVKKAPTPTPKPAVVRRPAATGSWVELPNVRPIPSAYYSAVHRWDSIVNHFAAYYHIDPDLIRRIIYVESKGYQYAYVASTGVKGLMQVSPMWFKAGENPYDPYTNIGKGTYILRRGYDAYHTWFKAVSYYCYGPLRSTINTFYASLIFSPIIRSL